MSWAIRRAGPQDARSIAEVHVLSWQQAYRDILPSEHLARLSVGEREGRWRELLENGSAVWVAEDAEGAFAFVAAGPPVEETEADGVTGEVSSIYLLERSWRRGAGRGLMEVALDHLRAEGFERASLWVLTENDRARGFYEALGWEPDGRAKDCFGGFDAPAVRYVLPLTS